MIIKGVEIGRGIPKICVPITSRTKDSIIEDAKLLNTKEIDLVEWRVDYFEESLNIDSVIHTLKEINVVLDKPLIFTFRRKQEGGESEISDQDYLRLNTMVADHKIADVIDVELFIGDTIATLLVEAAHRNKVYIIMSNHDFNQTPSREDITARLLKMNQLGGDIAKIAVMPNSRMDVISLLDVTTKVSKELDIPVVTMSMSQQGLASRLIGESSGSAITFGTVKESSAPGQIPVEDLKTVLEIIHKYS